MKNTVRFPNIRMNNERKSLRAKNILEPLNITFSDMLQLPKLQPPLNIK